MKRLFRITICERLSIHEARCNFEVVHIVKNVEFQTRWQQLCWRSNLWGLKLSRRAWNFVKLQSLLACISYSLRSDTGVSKQIIISSDNGLSPGWRQAIIWTNSGILLIGPLGTNFSEMLIEIHTFSFKKIHLKMSPRGQWVKEITKQCQATAFNYHIFQILIHVCLPKTSFLLGTAQQKHTIMPK